MILTGPTGIGKTRLALELASREAAEIISADSMQVYRGMPIGTAQPDAGQRARARFHLCGVVDPAEAFNVQRFIELAGAAHAEIEARGARALYVGGTGMYLRALRFGLFDDDASDDAVRAELQEELAHEGAAALHARLAAQDPASAARIPPADAVRIVRALEVLRLTGRPIVELQSQWAEPIPRFPHVLAVLNIARETLRARIALRTDAMLNEGWIEEVEALLAGGLPPEQHCFKALGYREIISYLNGGMTKEALRERIVTVTMQFAKRQLTWFRREPGAVWIDLDTTAEDVVLERLRELL